MFPPRSPSFWALHISRTFLFRAVVLGTLVFILGTVLAPLAHAQRFQQRKSDDWFWGDRRRQDLDLQLGRRGGPQGQDRWFWGKGGPQGQDRWFWGEGGGKGFGDPEVLEFRSSRGIVSVETSDPAVEVVSRFGGRIVIVRDANTKTEAVFKSSRFGYFFKEGTNVSKVARGRYGLRRGRNLIAKIRLSSNQQGVKVGEVARFVGHRAAVMALDVEPNGRRILASAATNNPTGRPLHPAVWGIQEGKELVRLRGNKKPALHVAYSPDGKYGVMGTLSGGVCICDASTGRTVQRFAGHDGPVYGVGYLGTGTHVVSVGNDKNVRIWDVKTGKQVIRWQGHRSTIRCMAVSPDGREILTGGVDNTMRLWDVQRQKQLQLMAGHKGQVNCVAFSPNGQLALSGDLGGSIRVWSLKNGRLLRTIRAHNGKAVRGVAFDPDGGRFLSAGEDGMLRYWDLQTSKQLTVLRGHVGPVWTVRFLSRDYAVSGGADKSIRVWRLPD